VIKEGFSMQTGAGGTSLATADQIRKLMLVEQVHGSFASGGITGHYVDMLKQGLFSKLYDVQCFDLQAVESYHHNDNHIGISASKYGNPFEDHPIVNDLDVVILGATEIDLDFNVNVTTDSFGNIIGGSGGHADTAYGAKITVITSPLARARIPLIKERVRTITTPGENIDILVTERGIAINPRRIDLIDQLKGSPFIIRPIKDLMDLQHQISGIPHEILDGSHPVGYVEYRDGTIIDTLYCSR
ncbi:MAG: citrate lyase subunit alpha, partial [Candidatus Izemoplasmatales bacterium]|nr:citrate lyase subunit alpha [Candidatus Izemoplasmatales bacterium]